MDAIISARNLTKRYGYGLRPAIDHLTFEVNRGEIVGFLGPNGAGKSTTMNILTGYLAPTDGSLRIGQFDAFVHPIETKRLIGYLPEHPPLYLDMTVDDYLRYVTKLKRIPKGSRRSSIDRAMERTSIGDVRRRLIGNLSRGYQQRVSLAQAIVHEPPLLILDEPTIGLDPSQIRHIRELIIDLGKTHTVMLSSHILSEVQMTCSRVLLIHKGRIVATDTIDALLTHSRRGFQIDLKVRGKTNLVDLLRPVDGITQIESQPAPEGIQHVILHCGRDVAEEVAHKVVHAGLGLCGLTPIQRNLEDVFVELTTEDNIEEAA